MERYHRSMTLLLTLTLLYFQLPVQCRSSTINDLYSRLNKLNTNVKENISLSELRVPSENMKTCAKVCVPEFKELLRTMLSSVTVTERYEHLQGEILDLLDELDESASKDAKFNKSACPSRAMVRTPKFRPFTHFIKFLQKLNKRRKRAI